MRERIFETTQTLAVEKIFLKGLGAVIHRIWQIHERKAVF